MSSRKPDFDQLLKVLHNEEPDRPTLFEFFMNPEVYEYFGSDLNLPIPVAPAAAFMNAGYDYATVTYGGIFDHGHIDALASISQNQGAVIFDEASFASYAWPDPAERFDAALLNDAAKFLRGNAKLVLAGPGGVLENLITLVGFDRLCLLLYDNPELIHAVTDRIGECLYRYYSIMLESPHVGACIVNDDWGFHSQTMLSPGTMREYVIPWHEKLTRLIHDAGRPAILHSCGNTSALEPDIIDTCRYEGKHSYEDKIMPVEKAYEHFQGRLAVLGGIDMDFLCRSTPADIEKRSEELLERCAGRGGYALGSGNSIAPYVPLENYLALLRAANSRPQSSH